MKGARGLTQVGQLCANVGSQELPPVRALKAVLSTSLSDNPHTIPSSVHSKEGA